MAQRKVISFITLVLFNVMVFITACSSSENPVVRSAPTAITEYVQLTRAPLGEAVLSIATYAPTPTPTLTMTDSGLIIYDDFNTDGGLNLELWQGSLGQFSILDGVLIFENSSNTGAIRGFRIRSSNAWKIGVEGQVRFSVETRINNPSEIAVNQDGVSFGISLFFSAINYSFTLGYTPWLDGNQIYTMSVSNDNVLENDMVGLVGYDEWHTLRIDITEIPGRTFLSIDGFLDGIKLCSNVPPIEWQETIYQRDLITLTLFHNWDGLWDQSLPLIVQYDYVAVSQP